jgi:hypothetical protein
MSQAGYTPIILYHSLTSGNVPLAIDLADGELAINTDDGNLYYKDSGGNVQIIAAKYHVVALPDATSVTFDADTTDMATQDNTQAVGTLTINAPTGSPSNGQKLIFRLKSTNAQTFSWNAAFQGSSDLALPTASSGGYAYDYMGFIWNSSAAKWQIIAKVFGF